MKTNDAYDLRNRVKIRNHHTGKVTIGCSYGELVLVADKAASTPLDISNANLHGANFERLNNGEIDLSDVYDKFICSFIDLKISLNQ